MNGNGVPRFLSGFAFAGALILAGMMAAGWSAAEALVAFGQPGTPTSYAAMLEGATRPLRTVMALDNLFVVAYLGAFTGAAALLWDRTRILAQVGLGFALAAGFADLVENAVTVEIARAVEMGVPIREGAIAAVTFLGLAKYSIAGVSLAALGGGLWMGLKPSPFNRAAALLFMLFPGVNAVVVVSPGASLLLIAWMLAMLLASGVLLRREG